MIRWPVIVVAVLAAVLCTGCDPVNLALFRRQIRERPPRYERDGARHLVRLRFSEPLLDRATLVDAGIPLEDGAAGKSVANYMMRIAGYPNEAFQLVFRFSDSKLESVEMPDLLPELLGEGNVAAFFRMVGGAKLPPNAFEDVSVSRAEELLALHYNRPAQLGLTFTVRLQPGDRTCRDIALTFGRVDLHAPFKNLTLQLKRPDGD